MHKSMKRFLLRLAPPILVDAIHSLSRMREYGYFGNYQSWNNALKDTTSYGHDVILDKVKTALLAVKSGDALFERDSVLFYKQEYSYPLLTGLFVAASRNGNCLNVLDFGGSLGSAFFQNADLFHIVLERIRWNIVEQPHYVKCGSEFFSDNELWFYNAIDKCHEETNPNVILFGSSLQYIENPIALLKDIQGFNYDVIIIDRVLINYDDIGCDIITKQIVHPSIYRASYPAWFFCLSNIIEVLEEKYKLVMEHDYTEKHEVKGHKTGMKCLTFLKR